MNLPVPAELLDVIAERVAGIVLEHLDGRLAQGEGGWLDVGAAARHLCCKPMRVYDLVHQRRLEAHRDGSRLLFRRAELDAYVRADTALTPASDLAQQRESRGDGRTRNPQVRRAA